MNRSFTTAALLAAGAAACSIVPDFGPSGATAGAKTPAADLNQYSQMQAALDQGRAEFLPAGASATEAAESKLYWIDSPTVVMPAAHRFDHAAATRLDYVFSIGTAAAASFSASDTLVATALPDTGSYLFYDATQPGTRIGQLATVAPSRGIHAWPYAVDHDTAYVVAPDAATGKPVLLQWTAHGGAEVVTSLASAAGVDLEEPSDLAVSGSHVALLIAGDLWILDAHAKTAAQVNMDGAVRSPVVLAGAGAIVATQDNRLAFYNGLSSRPLMLSDAILASSFRINDTFKDAHLYRGGDFASYGSWVVYCGSSGVFGFDVTGGRIVPILLSPNEGNTQINYVHPAVLSDGTLYVKALTASSGSPANDGPVYSVDLTKILGSAN